MVHCITAGMRADDPTRGVKRPPIRTDGYRTWTEDDIRAFEANHPIGSRAWLALSLLLFTAQRRADIVRLGRQHIRNGLLQLRQQKTGVTLTIPVHPALAEILDATPSDHLTFLVTAAGKPFSAAGFTNWFRDMCNQAGLPRGTSAHGLRKAIARRLAEKGASAHEIAAVTGHRTLAEVQRYADKANRATMGTAAIALLAGTPREQKVSNHPRRFDNSVTKPLK
jgi:integrase